MKITFCSYQQLCNSKWQHTLNTHEHNIMQFMQSTPLLTGTDLITLITGLSKHPKLGSDLSKRVW